MSNLQISSMFYPLYWLCRATAVVHHHKEEIHMLKRYIKKVFALLLAAGTFLGGSSPTVYALSLIHI